MVREMLERGFYTTLGAGLLVYEAAEQLVEDLVRRGRMGPEEGRSFLEGFTTRIEQEKEGLKRRIRAEVRDIVRDLDVPTGEEMENLRVVLAQIENRLTVLEAKERVEHTHGKGRT